jgi:hypothetical protein
MKHHAGQYYHIYNRGTARQKIFSNHENYIFLLKIIKVTTQPWWKKG